MCFISFFRGMCVRFISLSLKARRFSRQQNQTVRSELVEGEGDREEEDCVPTPSTCCWPRETLVLQPEEAHREATSWHWPFTDHMHLALDVHIYICVHIQINTVYLSLTVWVNYGVRWRLNYIHKRRHLILSCTPHLNCYLLISTSSWNLFIQNVQTWF